MLKKHAAIERQAAAPVLAKNKHLAIEDAELMRRVEELINASKNRYRITVQVANRAKRRRYEDVEDVDDSVMKPICRAVVEMYDELTQPEIIGE